MDTKRTLGRPRATAGGLRKGKSIGFTPEEWAKVVEFAEAAGLTEAEYVRARCLRIRIRRKRD